MSFSMISVCLSEVFSLWNKRTQNKFTVQVSKKPVYCKSVHKTGYVMSFSMISVHLSVCNIEYHQSFQFTEQVYTKPVCLCLILNMTNQFTVKVYTKLVM